MHLNISIITYKLPLIWPPLIAQVVSKVFLIAVVLYKLVLGSSKPLKRLLAIALGLVLYKVIIVLLCCNLFLIQLICPYNRIILYIYKFVLSYVP